MVRGRFLSHLFLYRGFLPDGFFSESLFRSDGRCLGWRERLLARLLDELSHPVRRLGAFSQPVIDSLEINDSVTSSLPLSKD